MPVRIEGLGGGTAIPDGAVGVLMSEKDIISPLPIYSITRPSSEPTTLIWDFTGFGDGVDSISVDNTLTVFACGRDNTVRKITSDGQQVWSYTGHIANAVKADGYGNVIVGGDVVRKLNSSGGQVWTFDGHVGTVVDVAVGADGCVYSADGNNSSVRKISASGTQIWNFTGHTNHIRAVVVDASNYVYSGGGSDKTIRKLSSGGSQIWSFTGHTGGINALDIDAAGYIYSGSGDKTGRKVSPSGTQVWSYTFSDTVQDVAVDMANNLYAVESKGDLRCLNGSSVHQWRVGDTKTYLLAVAVDRVGSVYYGKLYRANQHSVKKLRQIYQIY